MNPQGIQICRETVHALMSATYSNKNYLFLEPVDLDFFPTYVSIVKRPMDLGTVAKNLEKGGVYNTIDACFDDILLVFSNAELFHKDKPENSWIVKLAKDMAKLVPKERKRAEKKILGGGSSQSISPIPFVDTTTTSSSSHSHIKDSKKKKQHDTPVPTAAEAPSSTNMNITNQQQQQSQVQTQPSKSNKKEEGKTVTAIKAKPTKPKLKLKVSLSKTNSQLSNTSDNFNKSDNDPTNNTVSSSTITTAAAAAATVPTTNSSIKAQTKKLNTPNNRGKELPKSAYSSTPSPTKIRLSLDNPNEEDSSQIKGTMLTKMNTIVFKDGTMNELLKSCCWKFLSALKRRENNSGYFLKPVNDPRLIDDYKAKISVPMDLGTISTKLEKNMYPTVSDYVRDVRRVFANCLRFNAEEGNEFRLVAREMIAASEDLMYSFIPHSSSDSLLYPKLIYCWKDCLDVIDSVLALKNPNDGHCTAHYFLHPVSFYCGGSFPDDYLEKVQTPMDLGTITSKLFEGDYQSLNEFIQDCRLVPSNCKTFYSGRDDGEVFTAQALRLQEFLEKRFEILIENDKRSGDQSVRTRPSTVVKILKPPKLFFKSMLQELRSSTYTDKFTKLSEPATSQFEYPVNLDFFPDYLQVINTPMNLKKIDENIEIDLYDTPEDFEYDVMLIFRNCETYNIPKKNTHIVNLAKHCAKVFRKMYSTRLKTFEASGGKSIGVEEIKEPKRKSSVINTQADEPPTKKLRVETNNPATKKVKAETNNNKTPKATPRLSVTVPPTVGPIPPVSKKSLKTEEKNTEEKKTIPRVVIRTKGPVPLHVAVAQIKENFTVRRPHNDLTLWEGGCSRFFRELKRHPWLSALRPKFIFHVPVHVLFPEIKSAYSEKVKKPMDLTTAECKLLQGGLYNNAQEFVDDIALVFANAVTFNQAGRDVGEPMSWAYYEASTHLLRYTRWLSLEYLSQYLVDDAHVEGSTQTGAATRWNLSTSNRESAKLEMEAIVMKREIEKSDVGEKYTWMESECEKLLKSLRHQTDVRNMHFFIQPHYPADYFAFVSKPMDWETCQQNLQNRKYNYLGEIVEDLRLIFSNAVKYNARLKDTDTISGQAYASALHMSSKLEAAIMRMLLSVSDRIEREKIDQTIEEREAEAEERAEEERLIEEWNKQREKSRAPGANKDDTVETIKITSRPLKRNVDFEFPFYDEEPTHEESQLENMRLQKMIYERQLKDRTNMANITRTLGLKMYSNLLDRGRAIIWAKTLSEKIHDSLSHNSNSRREKSDRCAVDDVDKTKYIVSQSDSGMSVSVSDDVNRKPVKLLLTKSKSSKPHKKHSTTRITLD